MTNLDDVHTLALGDRPSVLRLARELVRRPSRAGIDPYDPVLDCVSDWLHTHGLPTRRLADASGATLALTCEIPGGRPGPRWVMNTCLDTAPFGDETIWTHPPTSATITHGWLFGRGSADSKTGAAIFCHIAAHIAAVADQMRGTLVLLFDVDEHTGSFGGAKTYFTATPDVAGVMIGYPGLGKVVVGGRGVVRAHLHVHGTAAHSGGKTATPNAIEKAADLIRRLADRPLPKPVHDDPFPPGKVTVTTITGGQGFSTTPDLCTIGVDIRTTPAFDTTTALDLLHTATAEIDTIWSNTPPTDLDIETTWPPYALPPQSALRSALLAAADQFGLTVPAVVAGPSNIGNYLAGLGIPATAGFGVDYRSLHATDECIRIDTIPTVQAIYHHAIRTLLTTPAHTPVPTPGSGMGDIRDGHSRSASLVPTADTPTSSKDKPTRS